jgi:hypothetical protein
MPAMGITAPFRARASHVRFRSDRDQIAQLQQLTKWADCVEEAGA